MSQALDVHPQVETSQLRIRNHGADTGIDCLFLLMRVGQRYLIINGFQDAFQIANGRLVPLSKAAFAVPTAYREAEYSEAVPELIRHISTRK